MAMETFDYVIVGAGSAGSVLANRLSEDGKTTVCVLEAGPRDWHPFIHIPAGFMYTLVNPTVNWLYTSEPSEWTGGRRIAAPRGKTLGGSSSINGHIYNRGQRLDFDGWAQRGNRGWGYSDVLPYFRRSERRMATDAHADDDTFRGKEGNLPITDLDWRDPICDAFIEGARAARHPAQPRLQRHAAGGRQLRPAHRAERPPGERRARLPQARDEAAEPHRAHARPRDLDRVRGQARGRHPLQQGRPQRHADGSAGGEGGDPVRRRGEQPAAAAGLGRRAGARCWASSASR